MKTIRKTIAAALGGIIAAGMLSAMPAEAVREQLGTYRRVGDRGLYLSDSGAIQVDSENSSGVLFRIRLSEEEEITLDLTDLLVDGHFEGEVDAGDMYINIFLTVYDDGTADFAIGGARMKGVER